MMELPPECPLCEQSKIEYIEGVKSDIFSAMQVGKLLHTIRDDKKGMSENTNNTDMA